MKIRSLIYWMVSLLIATYAAGHAHAFSGEAGATIAASPASLGNLAAIPDAARSALLFIGVLAVAYTYQRAWTNFRGGTEA